MGQDSDIVDDQAVQDKPEQKQVEPAAPVLPNGSVRFARVGDITPVFNSSADAVARLSSFVSGFEPDKRTSIFDSLNMLSSTDAFHSLRDQGCKEMIAAFRASDDFAHAATHWNDMDVEARVSLLNRVSVLQGTVFGFDSPRVVPFYEAPDDGAIFHGRFNPKLDVNGVLEMNIHPNSKFNSFPTALEMVLTQNSLAWLDDMADGFDDGTITEGNPLFDQARSLSIYRGIMDVMGNMPQNEADLAGFLKNASADMAEGISLDIVTQSLEGTYCDLRHRPASPAPKGMKPG